MPGQAKLEDSNVANIGGKENKDAVAAVAASAAEWKGAGDDVGIQIWRIENFQVVNWPKKKYGTFFSGDSYIVLNTYLEPESKSKRYDVHFWLGTNTTADEMGTAAYKTVELDTLLGDVPVQYRQVQGHESSKFMKLFKKVRYLDGGVDSGFNHVSPHSYEPRLMQITGKKKIRVSEVKLELASLNNGDVFLLDNGLELIQWSGTRATGKERNKAREVCIDLREDRLGKPKVRYLDGDDDDEVFWELLGGKGPVAAPTPDVDIKNEAPSLWQLSDSTGSLSLEPVTLSLSNLDSKDVFIADSGVHLFVWVGSGASHNERKSAMAFATKYLTAKNKPLHTPVTRVIEGNVPKSFRKLFR